MVKIAVIGDGKETITKKLPKGFELDNNYPEIVISYGGDGTFLMAEEKYPGIPRLFVKHLWTCKDCKNHDFSRMFNSLLKKEYSVLEFDKLEASINGKKTFIAMNDINLHYIPPRAVRFTLEANNKLIDNEVISDGFIVSTQFGSTGYFHSVSRKSFSKGYGIAINNPTVPMDPIIVENLNVEAKILRGPAIIVADCQDKTIPLKDKDIISIKPYKEKAKIIQIGKDLRYRDY